MNTRTKHGLHEATDTADPFHILKGTCAAPLWKYIRIGGSKVPPRLPQKCDMESPFTEHMVLYSEHISIEWALQTD